jgi:hypothetical protein
MRVCPDLGREPKKSNVSPGLWADAKGEALLSGLLPISNRKDDAYFPSNPRGDPTPVHMS